ncbi:sulfatase-like hydrolase/transferase [Pseudomonas aeruginosa]|nr:sulfatase-like hydrolase/transferase [Pseudomonas aeruginosa]
MTSASRYLALRRRDIHPRLQGLADEGVRLTNFYAGPTCSVSRSMLLTGVDNHQAGLAPWPSTCNRNRRASRATKAS